MSDRMPTVYYGDEKAESPQDRETLDVALQQMVRIFNGMPHHLMVPLICSFVLTMCAEQEDPMAAFSALYTSVRHELEFAIVKPEGSA